MPNMFAKDVVARTFTCFLSSENDSTQLQYHNHTNNVQLTGFSAHEDMISQDDDESKIVNLSQ